MGYYGFDRVKLLKKARDKYHNKGGKEKNAKYYIVEKCKKQVQKLVRQRKRWKKRVSKKQISHEYCFKWKNKTISKRLL